MDAPLSTLSQLYKTTIDNRTSQLNEFTSINNYLNLKIMKLIDSKFIYTPFSTSYLTLLLYLGSIDITKDEISNLFGINDDKNDDKIIKNMYQISCDILSSEYINMANCYFINHKYYDNIKPEYLQLLKKMGGIYSCNFIKNSHIITNQINNWIANVTNNFITNCIKYDMITGLTQLIGINVLYFRGELMHNFDRSKTKKGIFIDKSGIKKDIPLMNQVNEFNYYEDDKIQFLEMLYDDQIFSLSIFLPKNGIEFNQDFYHKVSSARKTIVNVTLPKFVQKSHINLKNLYQRMGCKNMFELGNAKFYNIVNNMDGLAVSELYNDTVIIVDDTPNYQKIDKKQAMISFTANHSFHYYIKHEPSDTIIIYGIYD